MFFSCKKSFDCNSCICMVSLRYRFFLQKIHLNIIECSFRDFPICAILAFISFLSFSFHLQTQQNFLCFSFARNCLSAYLAFLLAENKFEYSLETTQLCCVQSLHLYSFLHFSFFLLKQYFVMLWKDSLMKLFLGDGCKIYSIPCNGMVSLWFEFLLIFLINILKFLLFLIIVNSMVPSNHKILHIPCIHTVCLFYGFFMIFRINSAFLLKMFPTNFNFWQFYFVDWIDFCWLNTHSDAVKF